MMSYLNASCLLGIIDEGLREEICLISMKNIKF